MAFEGYKVDGDVEVESATLILGNLQVVDISQLATEVNIYQNLFNHYIEASFVMDDSFNLFANGYTGNEVIEISFRNAVGTGVTPEPEFVRHIFHIYEISDKKRISEFREVYIINCVSPEMYQTTPRKISRSYGPSTISEMVKKINDEYVYNKDAKDYYNNLSKVFGYTKRKDLTLDDTSGQQQLVIPSMPVDDAIDFLSNEADSPDHLPFYTFYEDANGFKFKNVSNLVDQPVTETYHHLPMRNTIPNNNIEELEEELGQNLDDTFKIISYNVVQQSNILKNANYGMYKSKTLNLDIHRRSTKEVIYDYDTFGDKFKQIENKVLGGSDGEPVFALTTTRFSHNSDSTLVAENHIPKRINTTKAITDSYKRSIFNVIMEVTVAGNDKINVGQIIELMFYRTIDDTVSFDEYDKYLSGKYLITKARHKLSGAKTGVDYVTVIECTRDGIKED